MWKVVSLTHVRKLVNNGLVRSFYIQHGRGRISSFYIQDNCNSLQSRICLTIWNSERFRVESCRTLYMDDGLINPFIRWLQSKADFYDVQSALWQFLPF